MIAAEPLPASRRLGAVFGAGNSAAYLQLLEARAAAKASARH
ncbi:MAG: hypothetical protein WCH13_14485 [Deltaproteobacteria bacterium]